MITIGIRAKKTYQLAGEGQDLSKAEVLDREDQLARREASEKKLADLRTPDSAVPLGG